MKIIRCIYPLFFLLFVGLLTNTTGRAQSKLNIPDAQPLTNRQLIPIRDTIQKWVDQKVIPSMAVGVIYRGKVIWLEGFGQADMGKNIPATPQTIYPLGSLSKSVSATGVMTLVEKGRISLEDPVNSLIAPGKLSAYGWDSDSVKVWHILNCAAGIPHGWTSFDDPEQYPDSPEEKDALLRQYGIVTLPPGKFFTYSNYSFGVADMIMERVSGKSLEAYLQESLFQPLEMRNTHITYFPELDAPYAMTYHSNLSEAGRLSSVPYGGLGYYSSAEDLLHYAKLHLNKWPAPEAPISKALIEKMHYFPKTTTRRFGLGWHDMGHALISNGSVTGANTNLTLIPDAELAIVTLTNISGFNGYADQAADKILDALLPDLERQMTYEKYVAEYETPYAYNKKLAGNWAGTIKADGKDMAIQLKFPEGGDIYLQIEDKTPISLEEVVFNRYGLLNTYFTAAIPLPRYDGETPNRNELMLYLWEGRLVGHIAAGFSNDQGGFRYGVYVELERE